MNDYDSALEKSSHAPLPRNSFFDVFLSHNGKDKSIVRQLGEALKERGLTVWLDELELIPGRPWQDALEDIIMTCRSAAVCVGENGIGPWEDPEMQALLRRFVTEKKLGNIVPVIPVLMPGAPADVKLPLFLAAFHSVDLRVGFTQGGLDGVQWGITGIKPNTEAAANAFAQALETGPTKKVPVSSEALIDREEFIRRIREQSGQLRKKRRELALTEENANEVEEIERQLLELKRHLRAGPQLAKGDCLSDRYELMNVLGKGGFATVWKAWDEKRGRYVAAKVLHGQYSDSTERRERFMIMSDVPVSTRNALGNYPQPPPG